MSRKILVVEDNVEVARQIKDSLEQELFIVDVAHDGEEGWFLGDTEPYDAVILDIGLPKLDGLSLLQRWRRASNRVPVLILTSRDTWREKVTGLRAGADARGRSAPGGLPALRLVRRSHGGRVRRRHDRIVPDGSPAQPLPDDPREEGQGLLHSDDATPLEHRSHVSHGTPRCAMK